VTGIGEAKEEVMRLLGEDSDAPECSGCNEEVSHDKDLLAGPR
jgi:hypothetical protein